MLTDRRYLQTESSGHDILVEASHIKEVVPKALESLMFLASTVMILAVSEVRLALNRLEKLSEQVEGKGGQ